MADLHGFMNVTRQEAERRPVEERVQDWKEVYPGGPGHALLPIITDQASRCMDCGVPFCHTGCPLGNLIPDWNDLIWRDEWREALSCLQTTNNFPEFTGRLCPAPCETACVGGLNRAPVTIKNVEVAIIDKAWEDRRVIPVVPEWHSLKTAAVVGSGPAGLATAQQLTRAGHTVVVYERDDAIGGLLRYGIPDFKMEKSVLDRRIKQMALEGTVFKTNTEIGVDITGEQLRERFDAVVLATGATVPRMLDAPGIGLDGVCYAMEYLTQQNRVVAGAEVLDQIRADGKHVVIIGGGDTANDCVGTAVRQGAASITQLQYNPEPPKDRSANYPWPTYPLILRVSSSNEEGGQRVYSTNTVEIVSNDRGHVKAVRVVSGHRDENRVFIADEGSEHDLPADLVIFAMGFAHPEYDGVVAELGLELDGRGNIIRNDAYETNVPGVFACGDAGRGQSLVVWAIAEGRAAAHGVDAYLKGSPSVLPKPVKPSDRQMTV